MLRKLAIITFVLTLSFGRLYGASIASDKFTFEEQLLTKVIQMEHQMELMEIALQQTEDNMYNTLHNLTREIENKTTELELIGEKVNTPMVAFNAYGVVDYSLETHQILILRNTYINEGDGYDPVLGIFNATASGLYMFTVNTCSYSGQGFYFYIMVDGNAIAKSTKYNTAASDCAATTTLTKIQVGQRVWVQAASGSPTTQVLYDSGYQQTTFSGVLLHG